MAAIFTFISQKFQGEDSNRLNSHSGYLWKLKRGQRMLIPQWNKRWFSIEGNKLKWYDTPADKEPAGSIDLKFVDGIGNYETSLGQNCLVVTHPVRDLVLRAKTPQERAKWIRILRLQSDLSRGGTGTTIITSEVDYSKIRLKNEERRKSFRGTLEQEIDDTLEKLKLLEKECKPMGTLQSNINTSGSDETKDEKVVIRRKRSNSARLPVTLNATNSSEEKEDSRLWTHDNTGISTLTEANGPERCEDNANLRSSLSTDEECGSTSSSSSSTSISKRTVDSPHIMNKIDLSINGEVCETIEAVVPKKKQFEPESGVRGVNDKSSSLDIATIESLRAEETCHERLPLHEVVTIHDDPSVSLVVDSPLRLESENLRAKNRLPSPPVHSRSTIKSETSAEPSVDLIPDIEIIQVRKKIVKAPPKNPSPRSAELAGFSRPALHLATTAAIAADPVRSTLTAKAQLMAERLRAEELHAKSVNIDSIETIDIMHAEEKESSVHRRKLHGIYH